MGKFKSNRDYTICLEIKDVGSFYLTNINAMYSTEWSTRYIGTVYQFKQDLNKVKKWKQRKTAETNLKEILNFSNNSKCKLGVEIKKELIPEEYKSLIYTFKDKTFIKIEKINDRIKQEEIKTQNIELEKEIKKLIEEIKLLSQKLNDDNLDTSIKLINNISETVKRKKLKNNKKMISNKDISNNISLSIVDVSFNFRTLKLKKLADK
jgi:glucose-6-phosphate isomerase